MRHLARRGAAEFVGGSLIIVLAMGAHASAAPVGLYRNGQLVDALGTTAAPPTATSVTRQRVPLAAAAQPAAASPLSPDTAERNRVFAEAAEVARNLRETLLQMQGAAPLSSSAAATRLTVLWQDLQARESAMRDELLAVAARIVTLGLPPSVAQRQQQTIEQFDAGASELAAAIAAVLRGERGSIAAALAVMQRLRFQENPPLLSSALPYEIQVKAAPTISVAEAAATAAQHLTAGAALPLGPPPPPDPADLAPTLDVQLTPQIIAKAAALGNSPAALYEFVRNTVAFQPYLGSRKGAAETLRQLRGNDTDQASLLLALLRASGFPCRYLRGTVQVEASRAANWLGVDDPATAASILATAGLDGVAVVNGNAVVAVQFTHVWVEAYVPYANYRGTSNDTAGNTWVPLDPSFTSDDITPGTDVLTPMGFSIDTFLANYISTLFTPTPIGQLALDIQTYLDANSPGQTVADIERHATPVAQELGLLPGSLPYRVLALSARLAELEDSLRYKVRFHLYDGATDFIDLTLRLPEFIGKQLTIEYIGATPTDQATIDAFGGIYQTPPNLVNVTPLLALDGTAVATATNAIGMGLTHSSDMEFIQPTGASNAQPLVQNTIIAGNAQSIGFDTFLDVPPQYITDTPEPPGAFLNSTLHSTALDYLNRVDRGQETAEALMGMVTTQDVSEAIVTNSIQVAYSFGVPVTFAWKGLTLDADRRVVGPFAANGDTSKQRPYLILTGMDGSLQENRVFEERFGQEAVSTIKILELASDSAIPICTITSSIATDCPGFTQPSNISSAVNNALAQGHVVTIPRDPMTVGLWSGTGYIDMNNSTGAAGYIISGGFSSGAPAGGQTVQTWPVDFTCIVTMVSGKVTDPPKDSPDVNAIFCPDDTPLMFSVQFILTCQDNSTRTMPTQMYQTTLTKKQLVKQFGAGDYVLSLQLFGASNMFEPRTVTLVKLDLAAAKILHNAGSDELGEDQEESPGAFLPVNSDDDDYSASGANLGADKDQSGAIMGEDDLLPLTLHKVVSGSSPAGNYTLDIPANIKVWDKSDRSGAITNSTMLPAGADKTVYVEGISQGSGVAKLNWDNGAGKMCPNADRVKLTSFAWSGPLNVPGHAIYRYTAMGASAGGKWLSPSGGAVKTGAGSNDITVLWDEGPVVGKAIYQAETNYTWDLEVNVVQVKLKTGATNKLTYKNPPVQNPVGSALIRSNVPGPAMNAALTIDTIQGPMVGGNPRGVKFVDMGMIQNGTFTRKFGDFDGFAPPRRRLSSLQDGAYHIDYFTAAPASTPPWYDTNDVTGTEGYFLPPSDATVMNHAFNVSDTPSLLATDMLSLTIGMVTDSVDRFAIQFDLHMYFAVHTTQAVNGSEMVFTQRGTSNWQFDGSGTVNAALVWAQTGTGNSGSAGFTEVTDGSVVPFTTGTPLNTLFGTEMWSTVNQ